MAYPQLIQAPAELGTPSRTFIFGLADETGRLDTAPLFDAAHAAGFTTTKIRLALKRLAEAGLATIEGRGRNAVLQLTPAGLADRSPDLVWTAAAYRADAGLDHWDGKWHLAAFEVPEQQRTARDALRNQIVDLIGGSLTPGLYLSAMPWEPWLHAIAQTHDITDRLTTTETTVLHHGGTSDPNKIATIVWPVAEINRQYQQFIKKWEPLVTNIPTEPALAVRAAFEVSTDLEDVLRHDPVLPTQLVPENFAGPRARQLFRQLNQALAHHEIIAQANLHSAYNTAITSALETDRETFWRHAFHQTSARGSEG